MKFSSGLLNYLTASNITYNGFIKTVFYSEIGTNFEIGEKVFIVNGNYDSNNFFLSNSFLEGSDGYTILNINKCEITLDINYTGTSVFNQDSFDNYIKLYNISSQNEFNYINAITSYTYATFSNKFEYGLVNDFIYAATAFSGTNSIIGSNSGITNSGFYQKQTSTGNWINITSGFTSGNIYFTSSYSLSNNGELYIIGNQFTYASQSYLPNLVYTFSVGNWTIDIASQKSYITRLNFMNGDFNGTWNEGIFGSYVATSSWTGNNSTWNNGIFLNSNWLNGTMNSITDNIVSNNNFINTSLFNPSFTNVQESTFNPVLNTPIPAIRNISFNQTVKQINNNSTQSYYCGLTNGTPIQSSDYSNNNGNGFNFIIESNIYNGNILNGNFERCNIGLSNSTNSLDVHYGLSYSYNLILNKGKYQYCNINSIAAANSTFAYSKIHNSNINTSILSSNHINNTVATGNYNSNGIPVIAADLWSYYINGETRGILKLYIDNNDLKKLTFFKKFFIDGINKELYSKLFTNETKAYINLENEYTLNIFNNYQIAGTDSIIASTKTQNENLYRIYASTTDGINFTNNFAENPYNYCSIDIDLGYNFGWYNFSASNIYNVASPFIIDNIENLFTNTTICDADFTSGILLNSNWSNGDAINDIRNIIISTAPSVLSISIPFGSTNSLIIDINDGNNLNINEYIFLNGIDFIGTTQSVAFGGIFKLNAFLVPSLPNSRKLLLLEQTTNINSLSFSGYFGIVGVAPNYISISKFKIDNSTINNGLFKSTLILNSTSSNVNFNNRDTALTISNNNILRYINTLFKDDNNKINAGLIYNSHIMNTTWNNGIAFNSILLNATFSNGVFNNGYWLNGIFNNGIFLNSIATASNTPMYDLLDNYRAWRYGAFNNGQFYNSTWIDGTFNNGNIFYSDWYGGIFNGGILGIKNSSSYLNTTMGYHANLGTGSTSTSFNNGTVQNATIGGNSIINWYNGIFNDGEFTSLDASSTWHNGIFNGGKFDGQAQWINGTFNNGKFLSIYGFTLSSSTSSNDYAWVYGIFNNGQFGNGFGITNSTWFDGEFNGGNFKGLVWNTGVFTNGNFFGSSTTQSYQNETNFVNQYNLTASYYGLWRNGFIADTVHIGKPEQKVYTNIHITSLIKKSNNIVNINNALWLHGTFSHATGNMNNCVWLDGTFIRGTFNNSAFNPFVDSTLNGATPSFNFNESCIWQNGSFNGGTFYISVWQNGSFNSGYMLGGIWQNGIWFYGTADNIYWASGDWKNGNWYGTNFSYNTVNNSMIIDDPKTLAVLYNIASHTGTSSIHLLNAFTGSVSPEILYDGTFSHEISGDYAGWTQSGSNNWNFETGYTIWHLHHEVSTIGNNYMFSGTGSSNILYGASSSAGLTNSIFVTSSVNYTINFDINTHLFPEIGVYGPINITLYIGNTTSTVYALPNNTTAFTLYYTGADLATWILGNSSFGIQKIGNGQNVSTSILNVSIQSTLIEYDMINNNNLFTSYSYSPTMSATVSLPGLILNSNSGVGLLYGNGVFVMGLWENGVWNNGYRNDTTLSYCQLFPIAFYIKMSKYVHRIQLQFISTPTINYNIGDYVSVGNIVAIDANNVRKLIKDKWTVINNNGHNIVLEIMLNYPILEITQDSDLHLIYLSKNIWLSGVFLNGYFNGIWNYGLFNGFPYITSMTSSHWIDGYFNGGHFFSGTASILNINNSLIEDYNTGLIQNFNFNDLNVAEPYNFLYQSWIDVNYDFNSMTNIGDNPIYSTQSDGTVNITTNPYKRSIPDMNGYITYDILSSHSNFRKGNSNNIIAFKLGTKYTKYTNYIPNNGLFIDPFSSTLNPPGSENFIGGGWTFSINTRPIKYEAGISPNAMLLTTSSDPQYFSKLDNLDINIQPNRYSMVEIQLQITSDSGFDALRLYTSYTKATYSLFTDNSIDYAQIYFDNSYTGILTVQEFFYNKPDLGINIDDYNTDDTVPYYILFPEISYIEVDMIPFFQYTTESNVDNNIKQNYLATAPIINYNNANFNFINNVQLLLTSEIIANSASIFNQSIGGSNLFL